MTDVSVKTKEIDLLIKTNGRVSTQDVLARLNGWLYYTQVVTLDRRPEPIEHIIVILVNNELVYPGRGGVFKTGDKVYVYFQTNIDGVVTEYDGTFTME